MKAFVLPSVSFLILGCLLEDQGVVRPKPGLLKPLSTYQGVTYVDEDNVTPAHFQNLTQPKLVVIWQFVGLATERADYTESSVNSNAPWDFSGQIMLPPPPEVTQSQDMAIGKLVLYSDGDGDNQLNRWTHPSMAPILEERERMNREYQSALHHLLNNFAEIRNPEAFWETFFVDSAENIYMEVLGQRLKVFDPAAYGLKVVPGLHRILLEARMRLLGHRNKWETFFRLRHNDLPEAYMEILSDSAGFQEIRLSYYRRLFPKENALLSFEEQLGVAVKRFTEMWKYYNETYAQAYQAGWLNYPFSPPSSTKDWVLGMTIWDNLLYIPSEDDLQNALEASRRSAFEIENIHLAKVGYNLIHCTKSYVCHLLSPEDSITIYTGSHIDHFDAPNSPFREKPLANPQIVSTSPDSLTQYRGAYEIRTFDSASVWPDEDGLWYRDKHMGLFALFPAGNGIFFSDVFGLQVSFSKTTDSSTFDKFVLVRDDFKYSGVKVGDAVSPNVVSQIESQKEKEFVPVDAAVYPEIAGAYVSGKDSLRVEVNEEGSVGLTRSHWDEFVLHQSGEDLGHPHSDLSIRVEVVDSAKYQIQLRYGKTMEVFHAVEGAI